MLEFLEVRRGCLGIQLVPGERQGGVRTAQELAGDLHWDFWGNSFPFPFGVMGVEEEALMKPQKGFSASELLSGISVLGL